MRKYIVIILSLFLFLMPAYAQESVSATDDSIIAAEQNSNTVETKTENRPSLPPPIEQRRQRKPVFSQDVNPSLPPPVVKQTRVVEASQNQPVAENKNLQDIKKQQQEIVESNVALPVRPSKTALPAPPQTTAPVAGNLMQNAAPVVSSTSARPALPPPPDAATNRVLVSQGKISLNFDDADIYSVIQTVFSEILKENYIIDPKVKGRVTFRSVAPVPKENVLPLMEVILRLNGVAVVEENSLYRIIPIGDLAREPSAINIGREAEKVEIKGKALLQVVPIEHVQSSEIIKLITPFTSANAVVVDVPKTNHIIVVDTDANVKRLLQLVSIFDSDQQRNKGPQVFVHHVQNGKAKDISSLLQQIFLGSKTPGQLSGSSAAVSPTSPSTSASKPSLPPAATRPNVQTTINQGRAEALVSDLVKIYADEMLNAIIILGTPEDYEIIKGTIAKLDIVPRQVLIEGTIAQLMLTDKMSLGLAWSLKTDKGSFNPINISFNPSQIITDTSKTSGLSVIGIDSGNSITAVINALASKSKAKLLASPHIMVSDNQEARIQVGQQVPLVTSETYGSTGVSSVPIRTIQYKDIGMILKVKPQINDSGLVALQISQEVSTYSKDTLYADETQIILNKTEASTNLVVQDGHTIIIGGLIREDDSRARAGIPFLSKIPVLGYLFGNTENEDLRTELVILLTPHVVKDQQDARAITNKFADKVTDEQMIKDVKNGIHNTKEEKEK